METSFETFDSLFFARGIRRFGKIRGGLPFNRTIKNECGNELEIVAMPAEQNILFPMFLFDLIVNPHAVKGPIHHNQQY